jgi:CheY-like chemotaxis protein
VHRQTGSLYVGFPYWNRLLQGRLQQASFQIGLDSMLGPLSAKIMQPAPHDGMPGDVLIVEDDPIIALDFEDTILGFGVKFVRTAANVAKALEMIADRAPDFALLDVGLIREKSFAIAERLDQLKIPFVFVTGYGADVRLPAAFADRPRLPKPYSSDALQALLKQRSGDGAGR